MNKAVSSDSSHFDNRLKVGLASARVGARVRKYRTSARLSPEFVARATGMSIETYEAAEVGESQFTAEQVVALCKLFDAVPSSLLGDLAE